MPILLGISFATFLLLHVVPGDPARLFLGETATNEEVLARLRQQWGLDRPLLVQYAYYLRNLARGDFGFAIHSGRPVAEDLRHFLPATVELSLVGFLIALGIGIPLGVLSGARANLLTDHLSRLGSLLFLSMPSFWFGLILIYVGYFLLGWLPSPTGRLGLTDTPPSVITGMYTLDSLLGRDLPGLARSLWYLLPPAFTLALASAGLVVRMLRTSIVDVLNQDYVRTARAKGASGRAVLYRHALRNAAIPTVTVLGIQFGLLFGGNVLVESVFAWPGIGLYLVQSIQWLDYAAVMGTTLLIAAMFILVNLLVDLSYAYLDPRIRYA